MDDIEICNNLLYETNAAGIWLTGYGPKEYPKDSAKDVYIHHNRFYKTGTSGSSECAGGIVLNGFQNTLIENNFFDGCYGAAIAQKEVNDDFSSKGSGYTTIVKNNIIVNTQPSRVAGKGYAINNKLYNTHSFALKNNCLSNNTGGHYMYVRSGFNSEFDRGFAEKVAKNEYMNADFPWSEAISAGSERPYQIDGIYTIEKMLALRYFEWVI
jgi:polygalacturonase